MFTLKATRKHIASDTDDEQHALHYALQQHQITLHNQPLNPISQNVSSTMSTVSA